MSREVNVLALIKGPERYVFIYDDESRAELLQQFGRFAGQGDLSFDWHDAVLLSRKVRQQKSETRSLVPPSENE